MNHFASSSWLARAAACALAIAVSSAAPPASRAADPARGADTVHAAPDTSAPRGVRYLYMIRHGMYDRDSTDVDRSGNGLNALGREQSRLAGERLAALGVPIAAFVTSDFTRAKDTAVEIGRVLGRTAVEDSLIHECTPTVSRPDYTLYNTPEDNARCDAQLLAAWAKYVRTSPEVDARDVLVCHGNVIRWFVGKALGLESTQWYRMDIANASITVIEVRSDGTTRLAAFSDTGHIPVAKQTWTGRGAGWHPPYRR